MKLLSTMAKHGAILGSFAAICTLIIATTFQLTQKRIEQNIEQATRQILQEILPKNQYDNDALKDTRIIAPDKLLGTEKPTTIYLARNQEQPVAAVLTVIAPNGYSGAIRLLVGITWQGHITAIRAIAHKETPGLGDKIEIKKNNWILQFNDRSLENTENWQVKKDGGDFDQLTGATITSRAVITAVYRALEYFEQNKEWLFKKIRTDAKCKEGNKVAHALTNSHPIKFKLYPSSFKMRVLCQSVLCSIYFSEVSNSGPYCWLKKNK